MQITALDSQAAMTIDTLRAALDRCMAAHPPSGIELALHPDANRMATLWASMLVTRETIIPMSEVDAGVLAAIRRWM